MPGPGDVKRSSRVAAMLAKELARLLAREINDPRAAFVSITRVKLSDDLLVAKVFVRLIKDGDVLERRKEALKGLARAAGVLRKEATRGLGLRRAPELSFEYDEGQDDVTRIESLLEEVKAEERARSGALNEGPGRTKPPSTT
jgi:ribosome-binding factor A